MPKDTAANCQIEFSSITVAESIVLAAFVGDGDAVGVIQMKVARELLGGGVALRSRTLSSRSACSALAGAMSRDFIHELTQGEDTNVLKLFELEKCAISGDDDIGVACHCTLENAVIRLVGQHRQLSAWSDHFGKLRQENRPLESSSGPRENFCARTPSVS